MPIVREPADEATRLVTSKTVTDATKTATKTVGLTAVNDSLLLIAGCWLFVMVMYFSLHRSNL